MPKFPAIITCSKSLTVKPDALGQCLVAGVHGGFRPHKVFDINLGDDDVPARSGSHCAQARTYSEPSWSFPEPFRIKFRIELAVLPDDARLKQPGDDADKAGAANALWALIVNRPYYRLHGWPV